MNATNTLHSSGPYRPSVFGWLAAGLLLVALLWPIIHSDNNYLVLMGALVVIAVIGAASLALIIRFGEVSFAHGGFMGIGAYVCVLLELRFNLPFLLAAAIAALCTGGIALLIGPFILRLKGAYFALATFLIGEIIRLVFVQWQSVTGGSNGIPDVATSWLFESPLSAYYFSLVVTCVVVCIIWRVICSDIGGVLDSIREGEQVSQSSGVPVLKVKVAMFAFSCFLVGVQGALYAHLIGSLDPSMFNMTASLDFVIMDVIGGMYSLIGPVLGAIVVVALPEMLRSYVELQRVLFGVVIVVIVAAFPAGIAGFGPSVSRVVRLMFVRGGRNG